MTLLNRVHTPPDQFQPRAVGTYCCIQTPEFASDWQLSLNGVTIGKNAEWCILNIDGFGTPGVRSEDEELTFLHGDVGLGDFHEARRLVISISGKFASAEEAWNATRRLAGAWQANVWAQFLRVRTVASSTHVLIGHPRRFDADHSVIRRGIVQGTLEFVATDPRLYSATVQRHNREVRVIDLPDDGLCLTDPVCFDGDGLCIPAGYSSSFIVNNLGNAMTPAVIVFRDGSPDFEAPRIENATLGEHFEWDGLLGNAQLWVDTGQRKVTLQNPGGTEAYNEVTRESTFFWLKPGPNLLNVRAGAGTGWVSVRFRHASM